MRPWRLFGMQAATDAERRATLWIAAMFFACLASTFLLRPLRNQFGVDQGVAGMPFLYSLTLLATVVLVLPFWWLANRMPSRRFVPVVLHVATGGLLLLAVGLSAVGDYDWRAQRWLGEAFWGGFSALNVALPAIVWIHAVEHFGKAQAKRAFGLIGIGGTLGAVGGSFLADVPMPLWVVGAIAAALLQVALLAFRRSLVPCLSLEGGDTRERHAGGGLFEGLVIVVRDRRARRIAVYMALLGCVSTAFEAAQTELVGAEIREARAQHVWMANVGLYGNALVLVLQSFCTGRLLGALPAFVLLAALPAMSLLGLGGYWLLPTAVTIFALQVVRRGAQFAVEKPAREVLFTPLALATKHKVKFFVDTFAYRLGDLAGALLQVGLRALGLGTAGIVAGTAAVALLWLWLAVVLGRGGDGASANGSRSRVRG